MPTDGAATLATAHRAHIAIDGYEVPLEGQSTAITLGRVDDANVYGVPCDMTLQGTPHYGPPLTTASEGGAGTLPHYGQPLTTATPTLPRYEVALDTIPGRGDPADYAEPLTTC